MIYYGMNLFAFEKCKYIKKNCLPSILIPSFDLGIGETEFGCEFHSILDAEVLLALEALF